MSHAGGSRGTQAAPGAAWNTGRYTPDDRPGLAGRATNRWDYGLDWDSAQSLQEFRGKAAGLLRRQKNQLAGALGGEKSPGYGGDFRYSGGVKSAGSAGGRELGDISNPYFSQGLGPASYSGKWYSDEKRDEVRWYEATITKFDNRISELGAIADAPATSGFGAGTQGAYAEQQSARALLGKPFPEAAAAAEQSRLERGGGSARRGGGVATSGRPAARATAAEQARLGRSQTSGGSSPRRRLRASNLLAQPLGGGGYGTSARQLLG
jgi:hypothetical protein